MAKKTTKINSVIVGPFKYKIKYSSDISKQKHVTSKDDLLGYCMNARQTILIAEDQTFDTEADTIIHELFHALWYTSGLVEVEAPTEEICISLLTPRLLELFRDNKKLTRMLFKV